MLAMLRTALLLILASGIVSAQSVSAATDKEFDAFWRKFQVAIQKNDKPAIASMTRCPFWFLSEQLSKEQLTAKIDKVFPPKLRGCIMKEKPITRGDLHFVTCDQFILTFSKVNGRYMFTDMDAND